MKQTHQRGPQTEIGLVLYPGCQSAMYQGMTDLLQTPGQTNLKSAEYAQHLRIDKARELFQYTRRPRERVAWSVGYEGLTAFRCVFYRFVGLSPGRYRGHFSPGGEAATKDAKLEHAGGSGL